MAEGAKLSAMYQDVLLAHYRAPRGRGVLERATATAERKNPLCGDQIAVSVLVRDGIIHDVAFDGRGCSIATASASMMTEAVRGLAVGEARQLAASITRMLEQSSDVSEPAAPLSGDLQALAGVARYPQRHGCALMGWRALEDALG